MTKTPKLTKQQKTALKPLGRDLKQAVRAGNYESASKITTKIQDLLRPSGHETRLMKAKVMLWEAALESGKLSSTEAGCIGVRNKVSVRTRVYIEATALLAICYLRMDKPKKAESFMDETLRRANNIKSRSRRIAFEQRIIRRFQEESILQGLRGRGTELIDAEKLQKEAGRLVQNRNEDEIAVSIAEAIPPEALQFYRKVLDLSQYRLPQDERVLLASAQELPEKREIGRSAFNSLKRVFWKALCDPNSDLHKIWWKEGIQIFLSKGYYALAVAAVMHDLSIGLFAFSASIAALLIKVGVETLCEHYKPEAVVMSLD